MADHLRVGDWRVVLADVDQVDTLLTDPPFSARTHAGARTTAGLELGNPETETRGIAFEAWDAFDVADFVDAWAPRVRAWFVALTDHVLWPVYEARLQRAGFLTFHPIPCVIRNMTVRQMGDGPASWAVWAVVARRPGYLDPGAVARDARQTRIDGTGKRRKRADGTIADVTPRPADAPTRIWRALDGAYVVDRGRSGGGGRGKPADLEAALVRDYSNPGWLVCDPCAGRGGFLVAAAAAGRRYVGAELDPAVAATAADRLANLQPILL